MALFDLVPKTLRIRALGATCRRCVLEWRKALSSLGRFGDFDALVAVCATWRVGPATHEQLRAFLLRGPVRAIVGQADPRLDILSALDGGALLLVHIPKGTLGEDTSRLLGALTVARVWPACMRRASAPEADRIDTSLYVDEISATHP